MKEKIQKSEAQAFERARILTAISKADGLLNGTWLGINEPGDFDKNGAIENIMEAIVFAKKAVELLERWQNNEVSKKQANCNHKFPPKEKGSYGFMGKGVCIKCGYSDY